MNAIISEIISIFFFYHRITVNVKWSVPSFGILMLCVCLNAHTDMINRKLIVILSILKRLISSLRLFSEVSSVLAYSSWSSYALSPSRHQYQERQANLGHSSNFQVYCANMKFRYTYMQFRWLSKPAMSTEVGKVMMTLWELSDLISIDGSTPTQKFW